LARIVGGAFGNVLAQWTMQAGARPRRGGHQSQEEWPSVLCGVLQDREPSGNVSMGVKKQVEARRLPVVEKQFSDYEQGECIVARRGNRTVERQENATSASAKSLTVARRGIETSTDFKQIMSSMMADLLQNKVSPQIANAVCNSGGKLLKVVEMELKYATKQGASRRLALTQ
jgi:hypothetical protein